jgi:hypothetical protein
LKPPTLEAIRNEKCKRSALYWSQHWTKTENPHYLEEGLEFTAPLPDWSYFDVLFKSLSSESRIFIPKTRQMMTSWACVIHAVHRAQWFKAQAVVQTDSEEKAKELVGYAECLYRNQPDWLKARHPLESPASALNIEWADGGKIFGIPKGENKLRMYHPTIYIMDEAAFLPEAQQCYDVAQPVCNQIIAISSAGPGWFAQECTR